MKARLAAGALALVAALGVVPAEAGASGGICLMNLRFDFTDGEISNNSPARSYDMTGSGTCQTSAGIGKTGVMGGTGTASPSHCLTLSMFGTYAFNMFPEPAPPDSNGVFNFVGTASAGLGRWDGIGQPTFVGLAPMAGGGVVPCVNGTNSITFTTILVFVDP